MQEEQQQKQNPVILYVYHIVEHWVYPFFCNMHTHTCRNNTHTCARTPYGTCPQEKKRKFSFNEVNNTWHILTYFYYTLPLFVTTSSEFSLPALLTTGCCIWMKKDGHTHTHTHKEKRVVLQLERGRYKCHSFFCDATRGNSMNTYTDSHTHICLCLLSNLLCKILDIAWVNFHFPPPKKNKLVSSGTTRHQRGARWSMQVRIPLSLCLNWPTLLCTLSHPPLPASTSLVHWICINICQSNEMHEKVGV